MFPSDIYAPPLTMLSPLTTPLYALIHPIHRRRWPDCLTSIKEQFHIQIRHCIKSIIINKRNGDLSKFGTILINPIGYSGFKSFGSSDNNVVRDQKVQLSDDLINNPDIWFQKWFQLPRYLKCAKNRRF